MSSVCCCVPCAFSDGFPTERPLVLPIYLSAPAYNLAAMTSYTHFCFLQHIRASAFGGEHGSLGDGLAETFYYYSQNLPTVALLLPRAGLALALLLAFWSPQANELGLTDAGIRPRDGTFFRASDQTLTDYARGVLIANAAWTAWRILVLFVSWCVSSLVIFSPCSTGKEVLILCIGLVCGCTVGKGAQVSVDRGIAGKRRKQKRRVRQWATRLTATFFRGRGANARFYESSTRTSFVSRTNRPGAHGKRRTAHRAGAGRHRLRA